MVKDVVLIRESEHVPRKGRNKCLQFVSPQDVPHDAPSGSDLGVTKILNTISSRFYWHGQQREVENWCKSCELCAAH